MAGHPTGAEERRKSYSTLIGKSKYFEDLNCILLTEDS